MYNPEAKRRGHVLKCYKKSYYLTHVTCEVKANYYRESYFHSPIKVPVIVEMLDP
jgi:hypothetical protein